jgi:hypothetical protein
MLIQSFRRNWGGGGKGLRCRRWNVVATMRSPEKEQDLVLSDNLMLTRLDLQNAFVKRVYDQTGLDNYPSITPKN